ncbi:hypothetical protein AAY473_020505 [Plecturocebus cupreus]
MWRGTEASCQQPAPYCQLHGISLDHPGWSAVAQSQLTATSTSCVQAVLLPKPPEQLGLQVCATTSSQFFVFLVETRFHHVGQAGLGFLTSSNLPPSASQSAGIPGVSHMPGPRVHFPTPSI